MRLYLLVPALLSAVAAAGQLDQQKFDDVQSNLADAHQAMNAYKGGVSNGYTLYSKMTKTRESVQVLNEHLQSVDSFSAEDKAATTNRTMGIVAPFCEYFNLATTKTQHIPAKWMRSQLRKETEDSIPEDFRLMARVHNSCHDDDKDEFGRAMEEVKNAYAAMHRSLSD